MRKVFSSAVEAVFETNGTPFAGTTTFALPLRSPGYATVPFLLRVEALGGRLRRAHVRQVRLEGLQRGAFGADRVRPGGGQLVVVPGQAHEGGVHRAQLGVRAQVRPGLVVRVGHARVSSRAGVSCG